MQLLESKVHFWEATVHIKAELDFFFTTATQYSQWTILFLQQNKIYPYCLIFTVSLGAYKGQDSLLFLLHSPKAHLSLSKVKESLENKDRIWPRIFSCSCLLYLGTKSSPLSSMGVVCSFSAWHCAMWESLMWFEFPVCLFLSTL